MAVSTGCSSLLSNVYTLILEETGLLGSTRNLLSLVQIPKTWACLCHHTDIRTSLVDRLPFCNG